MKVFFRIINSVTCLKMDFQLVFFTILLYISIIKGISTQQFEQQQVQSYSQCKIDTDCKDGAFCYGNDDNKVGKCKCMEDYELYRNTTYYECKPLRKLGEECIKSYQCILFGGPLAYCNNGICDCSEGSHSASDGLCHYTRKLGEICQNDLNCKLPDGGYVGCASGRCTCAPLETPSADLMTCLKVNKKGSSLGVHCQEDANCEEVTPNSHCSNGICRCNIRSVMSRNALECLPAATLFNDDCLEDAQCEKFLLGSYCSLNTCVCRIGYHSYGTTCWQTAKANQACLKKEQCIFAKELNGVVDCVNGTCKCDLGHSDDEFGCVLSRNLNDNSNSSIYFLNIFLFTAIMLILVLV